LTAFQYAVADLMLWLGAQAAGESGGSAGRYPLGGPAGLTDTGWVTAMERSAAEAGDEVAAPADGSVALDADVDAVGFARIRAAELRLELHAAVAERPAAERPAATARIAAAWDEGGRALVDLPGEDASQLVHHLAAPAAQAYVEALEALRAELVPPAPDDTAV